MKYDFRVQTNSRAELEKITALLRRVWPKNPRFNLEYIEWLYRDNPNGQAIGYNAFCDDEMAAHYVVIPFQVEFENQIKMSALALNTAVDERHRGQGLFRKLAEMAHQRASENGVDHIVAIANANSTPTFLRHLGFHLVTPLDVRMCLMPPRPSGATIDWQWRRTWSAEDLAWRLRNPSGHYWRSTCTVDFTCIIGTTKYPAIHAVLKVESDPSLRRQTESQLPASATWRPVLWFGKCPELEFQTAIGVPMRFRPSPFNFIFHDLTSRKTRLAPEYVHFEAADFDVM
jgi:GNAT superfamily N-acetyltransferase